MNNFTQAFYTTKSKLTSLVLLVFFALMLVPELATAQPWTYDFGSGTGTANNANSGTGLTTFFSTTVSPATATPSGGGTYRVRVGAAGGSIVAANPGTTLGTNTELQLNAATSAATNKLGIYDWTTPSTVAYLKTKIRTTGSATGVLNISMGNSTMANDSQSYTAHYANSLVSLTLTYTAGALTVVRRNGGSNTSVTGSGLAKDTNQIVEIYANNGAGTANYTISGTGYTLATKTWDLWVDGTRVVTNAATAGGGSVTNLTAVGFFAETSSTNNAFMYIDDIEYSNALPSVTNYTVTFDGNTSTGGSTATQTIAQGASANLTANGYTKTGNVFAGWATTAGGAVAYADGASYTMGSANVTLFAKWTPTYTVTFDGNTSTGGSTATQTIAQAASANLTSNGYTKTGYAFAGWATTAGGAVAYANNASYTMGSANVTLFAKWTANNNTLSFNGNTNTGGSTASQTIASDASATLTTNGFTKTGYTFAGWATTAGGAVAYADGASYTMGTANATLFAKWTANNNTLSFNGNSEDSGSTASQTIATAASATLNSNGFVKAGFSFGGWSTTLGGALAYADGASYTMGTADATLYAIWTSATTHDITFDANTGTGTMANQTIAEGNTAALTANAFTKTGYTFAGWATTAGGAVAYANSANYTMGLVDVTLYAKWTANNNTLSFNGNTNTGGSTTSQTIATDATATLNSNGFTKTGYTFAGWATTAGGVVAFADGASYTMGTANATLFAKWTANNNTITFDGNTSTGGSTTSQVIATAASANLNANGYTKAGFTFAGWATTAGGVVAFADGASYTMGTANVTLFAKWTAITYTITFDGNTNTGGSTASQSIASGSSANLTANGFTKTGFVFAGWSTTAGGAVAFANQASYTMGTADLTLYAQWNQVVFYETMGSSSNVIAATYTGYSTFPSGTFTYAGTNSGVVGTSTSIQTTNPSSGTLPNGFTASGTSNVQLAVSTTRYVEFGGIDTETFSNLLLSFNVWRSTTSAAGSTGLVVEVSTDGITYSPVTYTALGTTASTYYFRTSASVIPSTTNLRIRFSNTTAAATEYRIDDVLLSGTRIQESEIVVRGNNVIIPGDDTNTAATGDDTDFGSVVAPGTASQAKTFTIQNKGALALNLTGTPRVRVTGANAADFTVTTQPSTPVAAGTVNTTATSTTITPATTTFVVTFDPSAASVRTAQIEIDSNDSSEPTYTYNIQGTGINSNTSDIVADSGFTPPTNIAYGSYQGSPATAANSLPVFQFIIEDGGGVVDDADNVGTRLTDIAFNVTSGFAAISSAALMSGGVKVNTSEPTIASNTITFAGLPNTAAFTTADFGTKTLTLQLTFASTVTDNTLIRMAVSSATAAATGSGFAAADAGGATSSTVATNNKIAVVADRLAFVTNPVAYRAINVAMPAITVSANDGNGNRDLDFTTSVTVTSSGTLTGTTVAASGVTNGLATFNATSIVHTALGTGLKLTAAASGISGGPYESSAFEIGDYAYVTGDFRTNSTTITWGGGSATGNFQTFNATTNIWSGTAQPSVSIDNTVTVWVRNGHTVTIGTAISGGATSSNLKVLSGGAVISANTYRINSLYIYSGGTFTYTANPLTINNNFDIEDNGTFNYQYPSNPADAVAMWNGVENFRPLSNFVIKSCDAAAGILPPAASPNSTIGSAVISNNTVLGVTAYFGNLIIDTGSGNTPTRLSTGGNLSSATNYLTHNDLIFRTGASMPITNNASTFIIGRNILFDTAFASTITGTTSAVSPTITVKGSILGTSGSTNGFTLLNSTTAGSGFTLNVDGDIIYNGSGAGSLSTNLNGGTNTAGSAGTVTVNLKGDLKFTSTNTLRASSSTIPPTTTNFNFVSGGNGSTAATTQTIDIASTAATENNGISFRATGSYVKLINQNLDLGTNASFALTNATATLDFGFDGIYDSPTNLSAGTTGLNIVNVSGATGTTFSFANGSTLKITSNKGLLSTTAFGNVQTNTRTYTNQTATNFQYIGRVNQETGDVLVSSSNSKNILCDLNTSALTLTLTNSAAVSASSANGLYIKNGIFIETDAANMTGAGPLKIDATGTYRSAVVTTTDNFPRITGTRTFATGSTIELNAAVGTEQTLRGGLNYKNVIFSNGGTKKLSSATANIDGTATIKDAAIVNAENNTFGDYDTTILAMTDSSRLILAKAATVPDMGRYNLTGGTIEFAGNSPSHRMRGPIYSLITTSTPPNPINVSTPYNNVVISGANVNGGSGNYTFRSGASFTVNAAIVSPATPEAVFSVTNQEIQAETTGVTVNINGKFVTADADGFSGSANASVNPTGITVALGAASTIEYNGSLAQTLSSRSDYANLIVNNSSATGVTTNGNVTLSGTLTLTDGLVNPGTASDVVAVTNATTPISGGSATEYVNGKLRITFAGTDISRTFPVGKDGVYRPVTFTYPGLVTSRTATIEQFESAYPGTIPANTTITRFGNRYWNVTQSSTGAAYKVQLAGSGVTPTGTVQMLRRDGASDTSNPTTTPNYTNTTAFAATNASNDVALGETAIPLTITGITSANDKQYDGNTTATVNGTAALSGIISGDTVFLLGTPAYNFDTINIGTAKPVALTGYTLSGAQAGAYVLPTPNQRPGLTADITPIVLTPSFSATAITKVYDTDKIVKPALTTANFNLSGILPLEVVTVINTGNATYDNRNVPGSPTKTVTASGLTLGGANASNYTLSTTTISEAVGTITPFGLTISGATSLSKEYDTTTAATITGGDLGAQVLGTDEVLLIQKGTFPTKNAGGPYVVTAAIELAGAQKDNYYIITQPTVPNASISQKEVTIINLATADKVYDKTNTAILSVVPATELQGEYPSDTANLSFTPSGYYASANVGNWTITSTTELTGSEKDNYILTQPEFTQKKDITPVGLTVTGITADNKVYDGNTDAVINTAGATLSGVLPGETAGVVLSTAGATGAFDTKDFGTGKTVTISGLSISGANAGNYNINATTTTANIAVRPITITATNQIKCAGGAFSGSGDLNVGFTKNYNVAGDILSVTLTVIGNDGSLAGSYPLRPSLATPGSSNYDITYEDGTLTVNQSPTATISGTVATCFGSSPQVTFTGANGLGTTGLGGTLQYEFTYKVGALGTPTTITTVAGSASTFIVAPTTVVGAVDYILISVRDIVSTCSNASTPGTATVTTGICTQIRAAQCGQFVPTIDTVIQANPVPGATQYRFEITLTTAPNTVTLYTWPNSYFNPTTVLPGGGLAYGKEYSIRVKPFIGATEYPYGSACIVKAPLVAPTPALTTTIRPTQCGKTLPFIDTVIQASPVATATRYEFEVTDASGVRPIVSTTNYYFYPITGLVGGVAYDTDYSIRVRTFTGVGGVTPLTAWGAACMVRTPGVPFSKLVTSQCNKTLTTLTPTLFAGTVLLVDGYRFRIRLQSNPLISRVVERLTGNLSSLTAAQLPGGYAPGTTYLVDVAVRYNGLWQESYGGDVCTITTPIARMNAAQVENIFNVKAFPNPFASHFSLDIESSSDALVEMKVYDMIGRQLEAKQATVSELSTREIGRNYPSGVYNVVVSQGDKVKSIRMVKR
ncbi:InlB B-repeat-containing protein [Flavobacterium luteum]|uniref:T9SS type A sorting domain-containing protein n=1 Tax=Flavobacterium luteum TaxID=2026654 RepID=A0A7J5ADG8_9FLAO|nr:InlB B-repeat-containing protein [Flavobacterium luteum]KAB1155614.1 T9SS type A sorting domain-containing protein [Flavobacterium luteum]